jgi:hypothetical protein
MKRSLEVIAAVIRKDFTVLWPLVAVNLAICALAAFTQTDWMPDLPPRLSLLPSLAPAAPLLSSLLLALALAHQDPAPGVGQDWCRASISFWPSLASWRSP